MPPKPPDETGVPIGKISFMSNADIATEITRLKQRVTDLEAINLRRSKDWDHERTTTLDAIARHVGAIMAREMVPVAELSERFGRFEGNQAEQLRLQREADVERGRRAEREAAAELDLKRGALAIESRKVDALAKTDEFKTAVDGRVRMRTAALVLLGVLCTAASGIIVNTCNHMPPQSQKGSP